MKHKYRLMIEFESEKPVELHDNDLIQFENGLGHFVETKVFNTLQKPTRIDDTFVYGTGNTKLKKLKNSSKVLK